MARSFARALRFRWLTPFYDLLADTLFHLDARKQRLVELTASCGGELWWTSAAVRTPWRGLGYSRARRAAANERGRRMSY